MEKQILINAIKENAKYFLDEAGEFFPFAVCVNDEDQFVPIYLDDEEEFPDDESMIEELKFCITKAIEEESFSSGGIAFDAVVSKDDNDHDAVRILYFENTSQFSTTDFVYSMKNNKAIFS